MYEAGPFGLKFIESLAINVDCRLEKEAVLEEIGPITQWLGVSEGETDNIRRVKRVPSVADEPMTESLA
jgi:hypothetical protein